MTSPGGQPVPALVAAGLFGWLVTVVAVLVFVVVVVRVEVIVTVRAN